MIVTRRAFMKYTAMEAALTALAPLPALANDPWDFLKTEAKVYSVFSKDIELLKETIPEGYDLDEFVKEIKPYVHYGIKKRGWTGAVHLKATEIINVLPEAPEVSKNHLKFVKKAEEYLYQSIRGLVRHPIDWMPVDQYNNTGRSKKGFLVNRIVELREAKVYQGKNFFTKGLTYFNRGGANRPLLNKGKLIDYFVILCSGEGALINTFSEIIPLNTIESTHKYRQGAGYEKALIAEETISDGLSHVIARRLSDELGVPNGRKIIDHSINELVKQPPYQHVAKSVSWIEKNGLQNAFDLYMDRPEKYMNAIGANVSTGQ